MVIVPKENPTIQNLNSYYLDINKMIEHYQGEIGSGAIHFKSASSSGVIFFDKDEFLNGVLENRTGPIVGNGVLDAIIKTAVEINFSVDVYDIAADKIYLWASLPGAEKLYGDLSTEFTDLAGLIKKMAAEKLTGYIDVTIANGKDGAILFLSNGKIMGGSYSWASSENDVGDEASNRQTLIQRIKQHGGTFNVNRITAKPSGVPETRRAEKESGFPAEPDVKPSEPAGVLEILEDFLKILEQLVTTRKGINDTFSILLKRKFTQKADKYLFLDPFAAEFEYANQTVTFHGQADDADLAKGVTESGYEIAADLGLRDRLRERLSPWYTKYQKQLAGYHIAD